MNKPQLQRNWLKDIRSAYDTVVIGSGLAGMTSANVLAKLGHRVLLPNTIIISEEWQLGSSVRGGILWIFPYMVFLVE